MCHSLVTFIKMKRFVLSLDCTLMEVTELSESKMEREVHEKKAESFVTAHRC